MDNQTVWNIIVVIALRDPFRELDWSVMGHSTYVLHSRSVVEARTSLPEAWEAVGSVDEAERLGLVL